MMSAEQLRDEIAAACPAEPACGRFWVDRGPPAWLVAEGGVDLFLQRRAADGSAEGALQHVMRAAPGQAFFAAGADDLPGARGLIAVPLPGTRLHPVSADFFKRVRPVDGIIAACEDWVSAITRGMLKPPAPRHCELIESGSVIEAGSEQILRPAQRVVWIEVLDGNALWMERYDSVANRDSGPLPLPRPLWLKAAGQTRVQCVGQSDLLRDGRIWAALATHQRFVLRWIIDTAEQAVASEQARLEAKAQQSLILTREAVQKLLSVVTEAGGNAETQARRSSCLAACQAIGRTAGIEFRTPHAADMATMDRDPIAAIAAASRVRYRNVALKGQWWTGDNGPLVAAYPDGGPWVALLPCRGGYEMHDPDNGRTMPVTEHLAARLSPFATMFYRVLPDRAVRLPDLGLFAMHGRGADLALVLVLGMLGGLLGVATPVATGVLVDTLIPSADGMAVWQMVGALVAAGVATTQFEITHSIAVLRVEGKMDSSLQAALWDRVLKLPVAFFRRYSAGDLALRINGVNTIRRTLSRTTLGAVLTGVFSVFNFALLFYYSPALAGVATVLVALALGVTIAIGFVKLRYERQLCEAGGRLSSLVFETLNGIAKLRVGSAESRAFANWAGAFSRYRALQFRAQRWGNVEHTLLTGYATLATAVLFAMIGMWLARDQDSRLSAGEFIAFSAAFGIFFAGMVALAETLLGALNLVPVFERARPILDTIPESDDGKTHPGELQGGLEIADVSFRYGDGPDVLKGVSFSVRPGGYVALVGPSGSGKSTLLRLLLGFEKPSGGSIYYDNQDLAAVDVQALRRQLGVVLQNGQLVPGDIFTNIVGASALTVDDAWAAARMVGLDEDIDQMPMGMHTLIGEGASTLSGGQRQRILIARAIVHRPRILFFDEATSALDNRTQAIVTKSLEQLKVTRIVIAHRLSTIVNADRIVVLQDGAIVQTGNYESLIARPGLFADLVRRQIA